MKGLKYFACLAAALSTEAALRAATPAEREIVLQARDDQGGMLALRVPANILLAQLQQPGSTTNINLNQIAGTSVSSGLYDSGNTALKVNCVVGCSATPGFTDNSAFTAGTTTESNVGGVFNDGLAALSSGNAGAARITPNRGVHVNLRNNSGTEIATSANPLRIDPTGTTTQPVSGTVTTTPPANASTNVAQFGGTNVVTGTGVGGAGIPRFTISNDSSLAANQSVNLNQIAGTGIVTGGLAGSQSIGGTAGNNAAINQNPVLAGLETNATQANPTAATAGNQRRVSGDINGDVFVRQDGPNLFNCTVTLSTLTTTQCQAAPAAGLRAYVTDFQFNTTTAGSATTVQLQYGTGTNCGTGTTALSAIKYPNTTAAITNILGPRTPLVPAAANAICATQAGTTAGTTVVEIRGFIAP